MHRQDPTLVEQRADARTEHEHTQVTFDAVWGGINQDLVATTD